MAESNKELYRQFIDRILNGRDLSAVPQYVAPEFVDHRYPNQDGIAGTQKFLGYVHQAFPDVHFKAEDIIAENDRVVVRFSIVGTHKGEFQGIKPTGRQVRWSGINIARFANGKIVELWGEADMLSLMRQLQGK
jgi:predicted ester cyclase